METLTIPQLEQRVRDLGGDAAATATATAMAAAQNQVDDAARRRELENRVAALQAHLGFLVLPNQNQGGPRTQAERDALTARMRAAAEARRDGFQAQQQAEEREKIRRVQEVERIKREESERASDKALKVALGVGVAVAAAPVVMIAGTGGTILATLAALGSWVGGGAAAGVAVAAGSAVASAAASHEITKKIESGKGRQIVLERISRLHANAAGASIVDLRERAKQRLGLNFTDHFNFAFAGPARVGKSRLIRALMGLHPRDPAGPAIGVGETTSEVTKFDHPEFPHDIKLWDIPGAGAQFFSSERYYEETMLYAFNFVVFVYHGAMPEWYAPLVCRCQRDGVPVAIVRGKADVDVSELREMRGLSDDEAVAELAELRQLMVAEVAQAFPTNAPRSFLVSASDLDNQRPLRFDEAFFAAYMLRMALGEA